MGLILYLAPLLQLAAAKAAMKMEPVVTEALEAAGAEVESQERLRHTLLLEQETHPLRHRAKAIMVVKAQMQVAVAEGQQVQVLPFHRKHLRQGEMVAQDKQGRHLHRHTALVVYLLAGVEGHHQAGLPEQVDLAAAVMVVVVQTDRLAPQILAGVEAAAVTVELGQAAQAVLAL
jgi:hypothetical protein